MTKLVEMGRVIDLAKLHRKLAAWDPVVAAKEAELSGGPQCEACGQSFSFQDFERTEPTPCCDSCAQSIVEAFRAATIAFPTQDEIVFFRKFLRHVGIYQVPATIKNVVKFIERAYGHGD